MVEDIYGIGALLALLITGRDPGLAVGDNMYAADPRLLNPHAPEVLITAARACLQADERQRPTAAELLELLEGPTTRATQTASKPASSAQVARLIVAELAAQRVANQTGAQWTSTALNPQGAVFHDMYAGSAGIALGVADAVDAHVPGAVELLSSTRETLTRALSTTTAQGLFTGRAGIAVALAASFGDLSTAEAELVRSAVRDTVEYPNTDWDLIAGNAGMAIAAVTVAEVTRDNSLLDVARGHAAVVVASAIGDPVRPAWEMDDQLNSGMAHGSAGALASLLTVGVAAGDDKLLEVAEAAAHRLCDDAESCGQDGQGVRWHAQARRPAWGSWCHGSAGIAMVLARAGRVLGVQRFGEVALRGAMSLVDIRAVGPCLCHGLAGSVMAVDEIGRLTEDVDLVDAAEPLRVILRSMAEAQPDPSGHGTASSPLAASMSPDLLLGFAGLLPAMLANDGKDRRVGGGGRVAALLAGRPITGQP